MWGGPHGPQPTPPCKGPDGIDFISQPNAGKAAVNVPEMAAVLKTPNLTRDALVGATAASTSADFSASTYTSQTAVSDASELDPVIEAVLAANRDQVATYRGGKEGVLGFLVGQVMKETQGKADAKVVNALLREKLRPS